MITDESVYTSGFETTPAPQTQMTAPAVNISDDAYQSLESTDGAVATYISITKDETFSRPFYLDPPPQEHVETDRERDIADIQKLASMVGATFIPNAQPSPSPQMVGVDEAATKAAFNHGYLLACCNVANLHGHPEVAFDILSELGISKSEVEAMDLCDYDLSALKEIETARGNKSLYRDATTEGQP